MEKLLLQNLKEEIKSELLSEIRQELRETVKKEFRSIMFEERYFEKMIKSYIKKLCYEDVNYPLMLNRGLVKYEPTIYEVMEHSTYIWMNKKKNVDLKKLYAEYKNGGIISCSYEGFESAMNIIPPEVKNGKIQAITWNDYGRKTFSYKRLFELYERIYDENFSKLDVRKKDKFIGYISNKFKFEGVTKSFDKIDDSFKKAYNWKGKKLI